MRILHLTRTKNFAGRLAIVLLAIAQILEGTIELVSFGYLSTELRIHLLFCDKFPFNREV
jgi:hypothetical protein